jgi:glycine betaine catabolism B
MSLKDVMKDIEGYQEILDEIEVLNKYGIDYTVQRGQARQVLDLIHPRKLDLAVSEIIAETGSTKTLRLVPAKGYLPPFQAGQYLNLVVRAGGIVTSRDYSISSPPSQTAFYDITVRRVDDGFVSDHLLDSTKVGDRFEASSPAGNFYYNPLFHGQELVFLAGGSGITPFMSMIREAAARGTGPAIHLIYGSKDPGDVIFADEIAMISRKHPHITWTLVISDPPKGYNGHAGFITAGLMKDVLGAGLAAKTFFLCGPEVMYTFCRSELERMGIPGKKIRIEMYGPPRDVSRQPGWPGGMACDATVTVRLNGGRSIPVRTGEPLMNSLEREGIVIPALCRSGECSLCRTKLLKGEVFQPEGVKLRKSDIQFGYIHPCMAYPLSDLEIMLT